MASQVSSLIHDQNLNVHYNASAGGKTNVSKAPRKGGLAGRKPLGDLSNSVKPTPNQSLKKHNSNIFSVNENEIGATKITVDGSKKKTFSKAPEKSQTSSRKALSDISNSGKPNLREAPKKNLDAKLSNVAEEDLSAVAEEQFLHNHEECIKAQKKAMDMDEFLRIIGLNNGFPKQSVSPRVASSALDDFKPASPPRYLELEEIAEPELFSEPDSPPPCRTPKSPNHCMEWEDVDFMLIKTP